MPRGGIEPPTRGFSVLNYLNSSKKLARKICQTFRRFSTDFGMIVKPEKWHASNGLRSEWRRLHTPSHPHCEGP